MKPLDGKTAIVTGGARSIGRAFSGALAAAGARVVIADIADGAATAATLAREHGVDVLDVPTDVSEEAQVAALAARSMEAFGRIDILVNNAALFADVPPTPYDALTVETWDRIMAVNLRGPFLAAKHTVPHMVRAGRGKVINVASGLAYKGMPQMLAYASSKAAILGFTRSLSREVGAHGICVNSLAPGLIESESVLAHPEHLQFSDRVVDSRAIKRPATPEDLLGALIFLASDQSDFVTGQTIAVDGGSINT